MSYRLAEFERVEQLVAAAKTLRKHGYSRFTAYTPFAIPELNEILAIPKSRAPLWFFCAGFAGGTTAMVVQWWCNAYDFPLNVGGRPLFSIPACIPITFELTVLFSALTGFFYLIVAGGMPRLFHPIDRIPGIERATKDRHVLAIDLSDPKFLPDECAQLLAEHQPARVVDGEAVR